MKRILLFFVFVLSSSIAFSQGLAFSQILMVPEDVLGTVTNINGDDYLVVQVPQGKVWKITSVPDDRCNGEVEVITNINPNGLNQNSRDLYDYFNNTSGSTSSNFIAPQPAIWLGENHSLSFSLYNNFARCPMLNVIEYDVVP